MVIRFLTSPVTRQTVGRKPLRLRHLVPPCLMLVLGAYLTYHALQGDRGYVAWGELTRQRIETDNELLALRAGNEELMKNIRLLSGPAPDPDFLDERVRDVLGFSADGETVILIPPSQ